MERMTFSLEQPLNEHLQDAGVDFTLTSTERTVSQMCQWFIGEYSRTYVQSLELKDVNYGSPARGTERVTLVQRIWRLLQRPYFQQSHRTKARIWAASIAKFCGKRTQSPKTCEGRNQAGEEKRRAQEMAKKGESSKWDPKWSQWEPKDSTGKARKSGRPPDRPQPPSPRVYSGKPLASQRSPVARPVG